MARDGFSGYRKSQGWDAYWDMQEQVKLADEVVKEIIEEEKAEKEARFDKAAKGLGEVVKAMAAAGMDWGEEEKNDDDDEEGNENDEPYVCSSCRKEWKGSKHFHFDSCAECGDFLCEECMAKGACGCGPPSPSYAKQMAVLSGDIEEGDESETAETKEQA